MIAFDNEGTNPKPCRKKRPLRSPLTARLFTSISHTNQRVAQGRHHHHNAGTPEVQPKRRQLAEENISYCRDTSLTLSRTWDPLSYKLARIALRGIPTHHARNGAKNLKFQTRSPLSYIQLKRPGYDQITAETSPKFRAAPYRRNDMAEKDDTSNVTRRHRNKPGSPPTAPTVLTTKTPAQPPEGDPPTPRTLEEAIENVRTRCAKSDGMLHCLSGGTALLGRRRRSATRGGGERRRALDQ